MEVKNFKCNNCKKKFPVSSKAWFRKKIICQSCFNKLKIKHKSKSFGKK